jgi:hypothetical protein
MPRLSAGLLRFVIPVAGALIATETGAAPQAPPVSCPLNRAVYQALNDNFEVEFFRDFMADRKRGKSGVMRYRGAGGSTSYDVFTGWSLGLARPYLRIPDKPPSAKISRDTAISSVILAFDSDFHPPRNSKSAPPYLVMPGLPGGFHYWHDEQKKHPQEIIPHVSWKLLRCRV